MTRYVNVYEQRDGSWMAARRAHVHRSSSTFASRMAADSTGEPVRLVLRVTPKPGYKWRVAKEWWEIDEIVRAG